MGNTCAVLLEAGKHLVAAGLSATTLVADSGSENVNADVNALLAATGLQRVLAQVEVSYSNSMIEAFWRSLKYNWLFLNQLDTIKAVEALVAQYVHEHNSVMPRAVLGGRTPDEVYFGQGERIAEFLQWRPTEARQARLMANRTRSCEECRTDAAPAKSSMISTTAQLHAESSRMS